MAALFLHRRKFKVAQLTERLFHTPMGSTLVSALFGVALAFMFQKVCKGSKCTLYKSPPVSEIANTTYEITGDGCYTYTHKVVPCTP